MNVAPSHWLEGVSKDIISGGAEMRVRRCLVIHFTNGASAKSSIDYMRRKGLSVHLVIDRGGAIYQCRPFNRTAAHAGTSRWVDPNTGKKYVGANNFSIGIELANMGEDIDDNPSLTKLPILSLKHRNESRVLRWEDFPKAQLASCLDCAKAVVARYNLDDITGHDCIAPERKIDPGPAFPMKAFREACGFSGLPKVHWS